MCFGETNILQTICARQSTWKGMECGDQVHEKAWNVASIYKLQWGLQQKGEIGNKNSTTNPKPKQTK